MVFSKSHKKIIRYKWILPLLFFIIGSLLGGLGLYVMHFNEVNYGAEVSKYRFEIFTIPAAPGLVIDSELLDRDYRLAEQWDLNKVRVITLNGLFYLIAALALMVLKEIWSALKRRS